jgi:hypothetical protein
MIRLLSMHDENLEVGSVPHVQGQHRRFMFVRLRQVEAAPLTMAEPGS